MKKVLRK